MMAKLKDRTQITRRDPDFSSVLKVPDEVQDKPKKVVDGSDTPNVTVVQAEPVSDSPKRKESLRPETKSKPQKGVKEESSKPHDKPSEKPTDKPAEEISATQMKKQPPKPKSIEGKARLRLSFRFPAELVERAEIWANKARCPVGAIVRRSFTELRPLMISALEEGIKYTEIPHDRVSEASGAFGTTIMIDKDAYERLVIEIDPEGITGIDAPLARWARVQFIEHFDHYLDKHGY